MLRTLSTATIAALLLATPATAQFNNQWVEFELAQNLGNAAYPSGDEADVAWGDVDNDGDIDLVVVVKQDFTSTGKRPNKLFLNTNGTLADATTAFVTAADVPGDQGFNTPTNDRDVLLPDVNVDGWLDIVTATTISDSDPKHIGHPRIYRNLGGTTWAGFRFEDSRIPQLLHFGSGQPKNPRFCSVAAGDVTGNNAPDLYFGDYDSSGAGGSGQPANSDLNDRLLINDGFGFFTDQSQARMTAQMLSSAFGNSVEIDDFNLDGVNDVLKNTSLNPPQYVAIAYNNPANVGFFNSFDDFHTFAPYHTAKGDLNNDGRLDVIISDDNQDRYRYNLSTNGFGQVNWSSALQYNFLTGGDDGFASNDLFADLNGDGWLDTLHCDVDVDIGGYTRRLHIYRNRNTVPGGQQTLREERESTSSTGWIGVVGLSTNDLRGMHDVAAFDIDGDNDTDLVLFQGNNPGSPSNGMRVFRNKTNGTTCPTPVKYGTGEVGTNGNTASIGFIGQNTVGNNFRVTVNGMQPTSGGLLFTGITQGTTNVFWGTLLVSGSVIRSPIVTDASGFAQVIIPVISSMAGTTSTFQFMARDTGAGNPQGSDALLVNWCN